MGAQLASTSPTTSPKPGAHRVVDTLWLETLQRICARAAHEVKGALNGVSVNVEVVRSRSAKPDVPASSVKQYANAAAEQLDLVIGMTDALLALTRLATGPVELPTVVGRISALIAPAARASGRALEIDATCDSLAETSANANAVRYVVGECLMSAIDSSMHVRCGPGANASTVRIESCDGSTFSLDDAVVSTGADAGIQIQAEPSAISISFPR
jgi:signal transduction histidine kinase